MGKPKVGTRPNEFKYGMALYGVAWPEGPYYFVCGGGGMGLQNRIVWAQYRHGSCSDQVGEYKLGEGADNCPMRMIMCPFGASLLVGMASGGIRRLQIGRENVNTDQPKLVEVSAAFQDHLKGLSHEPSTMTFNHRGNLLAVGLKEGGGIWVLSYPSMRPLLQWRLSDPEVKDLDFSHAADQPHQVIASVGADGSCVMWQLTVQPGQQAAAQQITQLEPPKKLAKARFIRCRFARDGSNLLYGLINMGRGPSHIAVYGPGQPGQPWQLLQSVQALSVPGSAFDISRHGKWLAAGDSDGSVRVFDALTLAVKAEEAVSIAFLSGVVFNADNSALISVGGDANCHVTDLRPRQGGGLGLLLGLLLLGLTVVGGAMLLHYWNHPEALPYSTLQQLQSMAQAGAPLQQACSAGSFPLHQQVCSWVARAVRVLPDDQYMEAMHDEL